MKDPPHSTVPVRVRISQVVQSLFQLDNFKEWALQKVHWHIKLEHERGEDDIAEVEHYNDEDTEREGTKMNSP